MNARRKLQEIDAILTVCPFDAKAQTAMLVAIIMATPHLPPFERFIARDMISSMLNTHPEGREIDGLICEYLGKAEAANGAG